MFIADEPDGATLGSAAHERKVGQIDEAEARLHLVNFVPRDISRARLLLPMTAVCTRTHLPVR